MGGWPKIRWDVGLKIGRRARWNFKVGRAKHSNLITRWLMWIDCSCILKCILIMLLYFVSFGFLRRMAFCETTQYYASIYTYLNFGLYKLQLVMFILFIWAHFTSK